MNSASIATAPASKWGTWLFFLLACLQAAAFTLAYSDNARPFLDLSAYVAGEFRPPFQYRVLCAWLASPIVDLLSYPFFADILAQRPSPFNDPNHVAFMLFNALGLIALIYLVKATLNHLPLSPQFAPLKSILPFGLLLIIPNTLLTYPQANYLFVYDISSAAFFFGVLYLAHRQRFAALLIIFPIALFNRETVIFAGGCACLFLLLERKILLSLVLGALMLLQFFIIKTLLRDWYGGGSLEYGGMFIVQTDLNLAYLKNPMWWPSILGIFGFLWIPVYYQFKQIPNSVFKITALAFPLYFILMIVVGQIVELRIFNEFAAVFFVLFLQTRWQAIRAPANASLEYTQSV